MEKISTSGNGLKKLLNIYVTALDKFVTQKKKYLRGKNVLFMAKTLMKAMMKRVL